MKRVQSRSFIVVAVVALLAGCDGVVDANSYVVLYARDDSIDIDEGCSGSIINALVIWCESDKGHCIDADWRGGQPGHI